MLAVLAATEAELTMRTLASLAGQSHTSVMNVVNHLVRLGLVERRDIGRSSLIRLARQNQAAKMVVDLARLRERTIQEFRRLAGKIRPQPTSLILFGSFARGEADENSDIDVLAIRPASIPASDDEWVNAIAEWSERATTIAGNQVNLIVASEEEIPELLRKAEPLWVSIHREGVTLIGADMTQLAQAA